MKIINNSPAGIVEFTLTEHEAVELIKEIGRAQEAWRDFFGDADGVGPEMLAQINKSLKENLGLK
jgi:hypothetical protein